MAIKILHVIDSFGVGGAETWLLSCVMHLKKTKCEIQFDFILTGGNKSILDDEVKAQGSKLFYIKYSIRNSIKFRKEVKKVLRENNYVAIHNHQDFVSGWHCLALIGYLPPIRIAHLHNPFLFVQNYRSKNWGRKISYFIGKRLTVLLNTVITGTSDSVMDDYGYNRWPYKYIRKKPCYCGIDCKNFLFSKEVKSKLLSEFNWTRETKIALFIGRISLDQKNVKNQKNHEFAFKIANSLISKSNEWNFIFIGKKGGAGIELEKQVYEQGYSDRIKFLGVRNDVNEIMSASEILLFPSIYEGLGMVAIEAQANGLKVLMNDTLPTESHIIKDLVNTMSLNSSSDKWAEKIIQLQDNKIERKRYNKQIINSAFSIENSVKNMLALYSL